MSSPSANCTTSNPPGPMRIGLALSGGGFRASLFHLGVIRRLEELGIMKDVKVVSAVSGGSIIAAFYLCEMEKLLRAERAANPNAIPDRVAMFETIAQRFLKGVDHNLRTRALIFTPFYHPWRFLKFVFLASFRPGVRAELIQAEYDKFFFFNDTMDQLPVEHPPRERNKDKELESLPCIPNPTEPDYGPKLLLNTTSLLTGLRKSFYRDTSSGIDDLKTSDWNVLPLSRVVGASSGVPVLFPPTSILGDLLVDGGISDNQGIEGLIDPEADCNVILVSDASGQMQIKHTQSTSELAVYSRVNEVFQFQIRNKLLQQLLEWGKVSNKVTGQPQAFAFIHLLVNLKSRKGCPPRVPGDVLPALGRIRTDLDQFSPVECESLMYHGYTLIDAQLRQYCCKALETPYLAAAIPMNTPPLFCAATQKRIREKQMEREKDGNNGEPQDPIRVELEAGKQSLFLGRCLKKHPWWTLSAGLPVLLGTIWGAVWFLFERTDAIIGWTRSTLDSLLSGIVNKFPFESADRILRQFGYADKTGDLIKSVTHLLAELATPCVLLALAVYLGFFAAFFVLQPLTGWLDARNYLAITRQPFGLHWTVDPEVSDPAEHNSSAPPTPTERP